MASQVDLATRSSSLRSTADCQKPAECPINHAVGYSHKTLPDGLGDSALRLKSVLRAIPGNILIVRLVSSLISAIYLKAIYPNISKENPHGPVPVVSPLMTPLCLVHLIVPSDVVRHKSDKTR